MTKKELIEIVEKKLPELKKAVAQAKKKNTVILIHQDAFAVDYQNEELLLLGMAVKYFGIHEVKFEIIGKNRETLKK